MLKPDWATGPEWDGWKFRKIGELIKPHFTASISKSYTTFTIHETGHMYVKRYDSPGWEEFMFDCKSPEAARKAAEALLEAME